MLTFNIPVAPGEDPAEVARHRILWVAHVKQVHLRRPIDLTITCVTNGFRQLAQVMNLDDTDLQVYRVDALTNPCPGDHAPGA